MSGMFRLSNDDLWANISGFVVWSSRSSTDSLKCVINCLIEGLLMEL